MKSGENKSKYELAYKRELEKLILSRAPGRRFFGIFKPKKPSPKVQRRLDDVNECHARIYAIKSLKLSKNQEFAEYDTPWEQESKIKKAYIDSADKIMRANPKLNDINLLDQEIMNQDKLNYDFGINSMLEIYSEKVGEVKASALRHTLKVKGTSKLFKD